MATCLTRTLTLEWIEDSGAVVGEQIWLELPEMFVEGEAEVLAIESCPPIEGGTSPIVTGTFRHLADSVVDVYVDGGREPIGCTAEHPFWSETRRDFIPASRLEIGERVLTAYGNSARITSIVPRAGPQTVYGLEVYGEHVYHVGELGLLAHNASSSGIPERGLVYEITGTINGRRENYVGSAFDNRLQMRLGDAKHPARALMDSAEDLSITVRQVPLTGVSSRREAFQLLRTQEQLSLNEMLTSTRGMLNGTRFGWTNLNGIRARRPDKFRRDYAKWGDVRGKAEEYQLH